MRRVSKGNNIYLKLWIPFPFHLGYFPFAMIDEYVKQYNQLLIFTVVNVSS